ncbi:hypothetical protein GCM10011571_12720 [Marinithermofilum abyssi]|jgi:transposase-like protein|uniref:PaaD zinc beta ribbon domain-containing protein n=1 Tax=Marinithermofilum abyssi TaxID=1571185 RepID=A0A8J2VCQ8_9BACL|nr:hypothetical protein [Marinithermofilum abyssi]GGE12761.1 hypothetical protein GCM10011571_12720 [Marinithermofilum abyssi]
MSDDRSSKPECPFCRSIDVSLYSPFGTAQLVRQYYCQSCRSVFEAVKWKKRDREGTGYS